MGRFSRFLDVFPKQSNCWRPINAENLSEELGELYSVHVPEDLKEFWAEVGSGYFGETEIFVFRCGRGDDSLIAWNQRDFWRRIFPNRPQGSLVFFAETCFGEQIGMRMEEDSADWVPVLFVVDTFEVFRLARTVGSFLDEVLPDRDFIDQARLHQVRQRIGGLPIGAHYAPIVSPLVGGSADAENVTVESRNAHMRTALAIFDSLHGC
jgi:hypothetical protein